MLLLSNGFFLSGGLAAEPVSPKLLIDPMRFSSALSAMVPPLVGLVVVCPSKPSAPLRDFIVNTGAGAFVVVAGAGVGTGAEAGGLGANGSAEGAGAFPDGEKGS